MIIVEKMITNFFDSRTTNSTFSDKYENVKDYMESKITIAIVEDIKEIAYELRDLLDQDPYIVCNRVYHNAEEAFEFLKNNPTELILCDIGLPGMNGIQLVKSLKSLDLPVEICMFTVFQEDDKIFESIKAGAKGYILKNSSSEEIILALKELYNGGSPISPIIARKVLNAFNRKENFASKDELPLTTREYEILTQLSKGMLYKEIAQDFGITIGTVKQHVHKIYDKLQVNNKTEAINIFLKRNN